MVQSPAPLVSAPEGTGAAFETENSRPAAIAPAPEVVSGVDGALLPPASEGAPRKAPAPESDVLIAAMPRASATGDSVALAPEVVPEPAQSAAPDPDSESAGNVPQDMPAPLGVARPPLSLAQVFAPGEAPLSDQIAPSFDLVRVAPDGSAVIAGRAAPGANVRVFSGTIPVAEAVASTRGEFVVFLDMPGAATLDQKIPDIPEGAQLVLSQDDIVVLPAAPDSESTTPVVLHRTPDSVKILQPSGPSIPSHVSLDLVSYAESGAVQLAGRGQPGNVARLYADDQLAGEAPISDGGNWALEISDIAEGRYVLRVDEITPAGEVASRTESPFQRQFPEASMPESFSQGAKIIVQPGNTLWLMATQAYGNGAAYSQIFSANKDTIRDPDLIYPGQIFAIPKTGE